MTNDHEDLLNREKPVDTELKVERKGGEPTSAFKGASLAALITAILLMGIGLYNAGNIILSEKRFYGMAFVLSIFAAIIVQKNVRDTQRERD